MEITSERENDRQAHLKHVEWKGRRRRRRRRNILSIDVEDAAELSRAASSGSYRELQPNLQSTQYGSPEDGLVESC